VSVTPEGDLTEWKGESGQLRAALYPFLFGVFTVLALAAENVHQGLRLSSLALPLLVALGATAIAWLAAGRIARDPHRRGLYTLIGVLTFAGYGSVSWFLPAPGGRTSTLFFTLGLALLLTLMAVFAIAVARIRISMEGASRFLLVMGGLLLVYPSARLAPLISDTAAAESRPLPPPTRSSTEVEGADQQVGPDIYLIVLDAYSGRASLDSIYGHDNRPFEGELRKRGFFVPRASRANYVSTYLALTAMLNWEYLDGVAERLGAESVDRQPVFRVLERNRTVRALKHMGYEFIYFRSAYPPMVSNQLADIQIPSRVMGEFEIHWLKSTVLYPVLSLTCRLVGCGMRKWPFIPENVEEVEMKLETIAELATRASPKFVYAHLMLPHGPFRFRSDCSSREPYWPGYDRQGEDIRVRSLYVEQLVCVNTKILALVDRILARSAEHPIILLQADHGYGRLPFGLTPTLDRATAGQVAERTDIFAAYHLPANGERRLYDTITPVNVFRIIFNHYFGEENSILPDLTYWSEWDRPYRFTRLERSSPFE
jgi:hypothetical protein